MPEWAPISICQSEFKFIPRIYLLKKGAFGVNWLCKKKKKKKVAQSNIARDQKIHEPAFTPKLKQL